jgi:hypothetical protein
VHLLPAYIPLEENVQADAALRFHSIPDSHLAPRIFHRISLLRGPPRSISSLLANWPRRDASYPGTPRTSLKRSTPSARSGTSNWRSSSLPFPSRGLSGSWSCPGGHSSLSPRTRTPRHGLPLSLAVGDVCHLPMSADLVIDLTTGEPPPNLERLFLVVWTISGGIGESTPYQIGPSVSSRQDGSNPQKTAMSGRGSPLRPSSALPPFYSIRRR